MSQENVEAFRRVVAAYNRRDIEALLDVFDPTVETRPLTLTMFGQEATVYRGHQGILQFLRDVDEALSQVLVELFDVRDLGERILASGRLRGRGRASGAEIESPVSWIVEFSGGRIVRMRDYLDQREALQAAGLRE
jgi:ketosteroid isomerase-like protein